MKNSPNPFNQVAGLYKVLNTEIKAVDVETKNRSETQKIRIEAPSETELKVTEYFQDNETFVHLFEVKETIENNNRPQLKIRDQFEIKDDGELKFQSLYKYGKLDQNIRECRFKKQTDCFLLTISDQMKTGNKIKSFLITFKLSSISG